MELLRSALGVIANTSELKSADRKAAVRYAVELAFTAGASGGPSSSLDNNYLIMQEACIAAAGSKNIVECKATLKDSGHPELSSRLGHLSQCRNRQAHPKHLGNLLAKVVEARAKSTTEGLGDTKGVNFSELDGEASNILQEAPVDNTVVKIQEIEMNIDNLKAKIHDFYEIKMDALSAKIKDAVETIDNMVKVKIQNTETIIDNMIKAKIQDTSETKRSICINVEASDTFVSKNANFENADFVDEDGLSDDTIDNEEGKIQAKAKAKIQHFEVDDTIDTKKGEIQERTNTKAEIQYFEGANGAEHNQQPLLNVEASDMTVHEDDTVDCPQLGSQAPPAISASFDVEAPCTSREMSVMTQEQVEGVMLQMMERFNSLSCAGSESRG